MRENIQLDARMKKKLADGTLTMEDRVLLALAGRAAETSPQAAVYLCPMRQGTRLPAWFVRLYEVTRMERLADTCLYELGFALSYWPRDREPDGEIRDALLLLQQNLRRAGDDEPFAVYRSSREVVGGVGHLTGVVRAWEETVPDDPYITKAESGWKT